MNISQIKVQDYRNIRALEFSPAPELTVICGQNGQGKTNLLEAVWLMTGSKSFRGSKDAELIREDAPFALMEGDVSGFGKDSHIRIAIAPATAPQRRGRTASVNGVDYGRATNLAGVFTAVVFDPGHLSLVKGSPEGRRRFLDAALCQLYPGYLALLRRYTRQVTQKNALLKQYERTAGARELLDVFDAALAELGEAVSARRQQYLAMIREEICATYRDISSQRENLAVEYRPSFGEEGLLEAIRASRAKDLAAGFCTAGPHREDFSILLDGREAKVYASQGQQRSAVLALKLAEAAGAQKVTGEHPVMLLDDVLSELDETRQAYLLSRMEHRQTIVTACDAATFERTDGKIFCMCAGELREA